ncbi:acetylornithine transaminase [Persicimonas caeni]|uniref:Acetylornithine aminotransferase n=1 Tax=Persicimonas caeni TaxID=2292766 RepID=A0A4Y6Q0R2_PERCE|nr:acetylornithine transaminase [Persicimonas caeni]QDG54171.1 acetylornithine transaminase [Persicimonas caeni]QED35392.1 acetylornithine transaminase [Persicimonas caeni]
MSRTTDELLSAGDRRNSPSYAPARMILDHGEGVRLYDREGNEYLDFVAGIAVNCLGYNHPRLTEAICSQAERLLHVSNLFYTAEQIDLMDALCERSFADRVFFCNSGAEANEAAMKLARRYQKVVAGKPEKFQIVTMKKSFHGRTMGAITATGQPKYHAGFEPMLPGFDYAEFNNLESVAAKVGEQTAAVVVEPVQGEGGIRPAEPAFLEGLRELCDEHGALLIFDEVQTGVGRTGTLFAYQGYGVTPDIICLAKALGGGTPIGAMMATEQVFEGWTKGSHASTFGGNPLVCRAALTVLEEIDDQELLANARERGDQLRRGLVALAERFPVILDVRGRGLMVGAECGEAARDIYLECRNQGLLINTAGGDTLRFVPPLIITEDDVEEALSRLERALEVSQSE